MEVARNVIASLGISTRDVGSQRQSTVTDDEIRILGAHGRQRDPGAIGIPIPGNNRTANALGKSGIPRGPQPKNTLSQTNRHPQRDQIHRPLANITPSNSRGIQVEVIVGDNIAKHTKGLKESVTLEERPTKRLKTGSTPLDQISQVASSDGLDELGWSQDVTRSLVRDNRRTSQTTSIPSQGKERPKTYFGTQEFRNVEDTMNSSLNKKHRGKRRGRRSPTEDTNGNDTSISSGPNATSAANPIDLSDDEETKKPPSAATHQPKYQGTANEAHKKFLAHKNPLRSLPVQNTGRTSRHFCQIAKASGNHVSPVIDLPDNQPQQEVEMEDDRLDNKFRATNGKARSQEFASSPDVLSGDTTVGTISRQVSPSKGSSSTRKGSPTKESQSGFPPSVYSSTAFDGITKKSKSTDLSKQQRSAKEASAPWGIRLAAVSVEDRMHRSTSLGLQHSPNDDAYDVIDGGNNWASQSLSFRVQPAKLRKVWWSLSGAMVRFESARSEGTDNTLDIELCSEKDMTALTRKLQEKHSFRITGEEEGQMRKKFENRLAQQRSQKMSKSSRTNAAVDEGEEIKLLNQRKAKRDAPQGMHPLDKTNQKRRCVESRVVDQLKGDAHATRAKRVPWETPRARGGPPDEPLHHDLSQAMKGNASSGLESSKLRSQSPSRITDILNDLNAKPQTTYSTRSKTEKALTTPRALPSVLDDPRPQRYSKTHDMGKEWTKPLAFPKIGKKKAIVEWTDLGRLDEGEFFNDTLIEFYLRYLQHQIETERPELAKKIHFFNTFFFKNLTHKGKGQRRSNYELVERWTHGDEIFTKDYVVVPINEDCHWYVVIICNLPNLNRQLPSLDDSTSPLSDKIDPALRGDGEGRPNPSPTRSPSPEEAETFTDKETRASFAELSLEQSKVGTQGDQGKGDASSGKETTDDQEMLDTQLNEDMTEATLQTATTASKAKAPNDNPSLPTSAKKKGKRKSLPPGRKLDPGQPAIVTFDSLTGTHPATVRVIKDYLLAEADAKRGGMKFDEKQIKGMNATGIPKQDNYCDCGPFLLGYMAKFLEDPQGFMSKAMQKQFDVDKDWPTLVPSKLRTNIRELLFQLYREQEDGKRESAKKSGKYVPAVSRRTESSPIRAAPRPEPVKDPPKETIREPAKQVSRSTSPSPSTRRAALDIALPIDVAEVSKLPAPGSTSPSSSKEDSTLQKQHPVVVVDSQSQPHSRAPDNLSPVTAAAAPELPSTIQDSQPVGSFQGVEVDIPTTPPRGHYERPPEPASSPIAPNGVSSPSWSPDVTRALRSSPRSTKKSAKKREKSTTEVVELD